MSENWFHHLCVLALSVCSFWAQLEHALTLVLQAKLHKLNRTMMMFAQIFKLTTIWKIQFQRMKAFFEWWRKEWLRLRKKTKSIFNSKLNKFHLHLSWTLSATTLNKEALRWVKWWLLQEWWWLQTQWWCSASLLLQDMEVYLHMVHMASSLNMVAIINMVVDIIHMEVSRWDISNDHRSTINNQWCNSSSTGSIQSCLKQCLLWCNLDLMPMGKWSTNEETY